MSIWNKRMFMIQPEAEIVYLVSETFSALCPVNVVIWKPWSAIFLTLKIITRLYVSICGVPQTTTYCLQYYDLATRCLPNALGKTSVIVLVYCNIQLGPQVFGQRYGLCYLAHVHPNNGLEKSIQDAMETLSALIWGISKWLYVIVFVFFK